MFSRTAHAQDPKPATTPSARSASKVRGIVYMVSDGMSPGVLTLAEAYSKMTRKSSTRWANLLRQPDATSGLMDTASANSLVTDSAAASSSWGCGHRVNNGSINYTPDGKAQTTLAEVVKAAGGRVGLVTTATVTHATPAGFASAVTVRDQEPEIATQYLNRVDVILGGGSPFFDPKQRSDKRDLFGDFAKEGYEVVRDRDSFLNSKSQKILGTFTRGHLPYSVDRDHDSALQKQVPTLAELASLALSRFLATPDQPFLLQVEGARVDHAAHLNCVAGLLGDQLAFDDALAAVLSRIGDRDDILVVVTSDHGNANPGLNGMGGNYTESNRTFSHVPKMTASVEKIFAEWANAKKRDTQSLTGLIKTHWKFDLKSEEAQTLLDKFQNKPVIEWSHQLDRPEGLLGQFAGNHTGVGWIGTTHTSDPTLITAIGPEASRFHGLIRNTDVFTHITELLG